MRLDQGLNILETHDLVGNFARIFGNSVLLRYRCNRVAGKSFALRDGLLQKDLQVKLLERFMLHELPVGKSVHLRLNLRSFALYAEESLALSSFRSDLQVVVHRKLHQLPCLGLAFDCVLVSQQIVVCIVQQRLLTEDLALCQCQELVGYWLPLPRFNCL